VDKVPIPLRERTNLSHALRKRGKGNKKSIYPLEERIYKSQISHNFNIDHLLPPLSMLCCGCLFGFLDLSGI
jgi:hypothetical protein